MKFLLIGSSVVDVMLKDGKEITTPGGIYYSTLAISSFRERPDQADILTNLDGKHDDLFAGAYESFNNKFISKVDNLPLVKLTVHTGKERDEEYHNITDKLDVELIEDINEYDGILINMITGFDIGIDELEQLRKNYEGTIYLDVHTLSRGLERTSGGRLKRIFRSIPDAERWLKCIDILQCNESELESIAVGTAEKERAEYVLNNGAKHLIITKGSGGAVLYSAGKRIVEPPLKTAENNTVGCGDVFGAVFFYSYISKNNIELSLAKANTAAGIFTGYDNISRVKDLRHDTIQKLS